MLKITIPKTEIYDELTCTFINVHEQVLQLEHSLVSISKWESKWHKPFLRKEPMTEEETLDYIKCMTMTQNVDPMVYYAINASVMDEVNSYIANPMTATTFKKDDKRHSNEVVTSERIYYWMIALEIPFECQKWHLNRLLTLIKVCNIENAPKKNMKLKDIYKQNSELNAARKRASGSRG